MTGSASDTAVECGHCGARFIDHAHLMDHYARAAELAQLDPLGELSEHDGVPYRPCAGKLNVAQPMTGELAIAMSLIEAGAPVWNAFGETPRVFDIGQWLGAIDSQWRSDDRQFAFEVAWASMKVQLLALNETRQLRAEIRALREEMRKERGP